jgi:putative membrane protein
MAHIFRGMAAGLLAGCAASWVMNAFAQAQPIHPMPRQKGQSERDKSANGRETGKAARHEESEEEDTTVKTAVAVSRNLFEHELSDDEKKIAGPAVHYAYGSLVGAMYGGLAELLPITAAGFGMPFGTMLWVLGDEIAVPALGLAEGPTETSVDKHADALAAHLMYGMTTDVLRRILKHVI